MWWMENTCTKAVARNKAWRSDALLDQVMEGSSVVIQGCPLAVYCGCHVPGTAVLSSSPDVRRHYHYSPAHLWPQLVDYSEG
jgi:hypothetical protein